MTMWDIAQTLGISYHWVSRNWKRMGLHPHRAAGRVLLFRRSEVDAYIARKRLRVGRGGRPQKVIGITYEPR
ncbi:MAG: hypothetical protein HZB91_03650 [Elusimicrobia bacterium]|nr:hypothetical protein [Elusimicrobiota bacterium]